MNPKIKKINAEYAKNAAKIEELQARQKELIRQRTDLENNDILELVHPSLNWKVIRKQLMKK